MVVLVCGHVVCGDDFKHLGGKTGQEAMLQEMSNNVGLMDRQLSPHLTISSYVTAATDSWLFPRNELDDAIFIHSSMPELISRDTFLDGNSDDDDSEEDESMPESIRHHGGNSEADKDDSLPPLFLQSLFQPHMDTNVEYIVSFDIVPVSHADGNDPMDDSDIQTMPEMVSPHVPHQSSQEDTESSPEFHTLSATQSNQDNDNELTNPRESDSDSSAGNDGDASSSANLPS